MNKSEIINDLLNHPDYFIMLLSLYYPFKTKELEKYKSLLFWGTVEETEKIINEEPYNSQIEVKLELGIIFNQNIKWNKNKFNIFETTLEYKNSYINGDRIQFPNNYFPFFLSDLVNSKLSRICINKEKDDIIEMSGFHNNDYEECLDTTEKIIEIFYPSIFKIDNVETIKSHFNGQKLTYSEGLLVNPQIWYKFYNKNLSKKDIYKILDEISLRKSLEEGITDSDYDISLLNNTDL